MDRAWQFFGRMRGPVAGWIATGVIIARDGFGVPHVSAETDAGAVFAGKA